MPRRCAAQDGGSAGRHRRATGSVASGQQPVQFLRDLARRAENQQFHAFTPSRCPTPCLPCSGRHQSSLSRYHWTVRASPSSTRDRGPPAQFRADAGRVDGIAQVMAGAVGHEGDLVGIGRGLRALLVKDRADRAHKVDVAPLVLAADVVGAPDRALCQHRQQRIGVILDIKPVADVLARAVDRDRLARAAR